MKLELKEIWLIKELIYKRIDEVSGYENLEEELKILLKKLQNKNEI
jgi:hypothetical protein